MIILMNYTSNPDIMYLRNQSSSDGVNLVRSILPHHRQLELLPQFQQTEGLHSSLMTFKTIPLVPHCN